MGNCGASEVFGKDLGLMHELAVAGRKFGFGRTVWSHLTHNEKLLKRTLAFLYAEDLCLALKEWECFYNEVFGIKTGFNGLQIQGKPEGIYWLLVMLQGLTAQKLFVKCKERLGAFLARGNLDTVESERNTHQTYSIWLPDTENKSANCKNGGIRMTLPEELLFMLWHNWKTGRCSEGNICTGSYWSSDSLWVPFVSSQKSEGTVLVGACILKVSERQCTASVTW